MEKGILIVISGFSGAGTGTLGRELLKHYDRYALSVSATTRAPRPGEKEGEAYFFKTVPEFEKMIAEDRLIEYARYVENYYGTPRSYVEEKLLEGKDVILEIEMQGALQVKKTFPQALLLFVTPPSAEELYARLRGRGTETPEVIRSRMERAVEETAFMEHYDYLIVNDDLASCVEETHRIIQGAHQRMVLHGAFISRIRRELAEISKGEKP